MYGKMFLRCEGKKIASFMKTNDLEQWTIAFLETPSGKQHERDQKLYIITNNTVTVPLYHISIAQLKVINHAIRNNIEPNTLIEIDKNTFLAIEQLDLVLIPKLCKQWPRIPNVYMAVLWNPGGQTVTLKRSMTIGSVKESDYTEKDPHTNEIK